MRLTAYSLVLSSLVLQAACGDDGTGDTSQTTQPTTVTMTTMTMTNPPPDTDSGTDSASQTEPTSAGSVSNSNTDTGNPTSETEPTGSTTNALTSTDPTLTTGPSSDPSGDPSSDPSTDPSGSSSTSTDPSGSSSTGGDSSTGESTGSSSTTSDDTTGAAETESIPCATMNATLTPIVPNIMIVLDKSGSMLTKWDHDANPGTATITRWASLHATVTSVLNDFAATIKFGMNLFPSKTATSLYDISACPVQANVEVKVKANNAAAILAAMPAADNMTIKGGTPAAAGMTSALTHLKTLDPAVPRAVLFITDGAANCRSDAQTEAQRFETYDQSLHTIVGNAFTVDMIPTYVVGIDIINQVSAGNADGTPANAQDGNPNAINPFVKLNEVAMLGGKPKNDPNEKFYQANNQIELSAALDAIIQDAISCVIPLAEEPAKPEFTEVEIMGMSIPHVNNCDNENGWVFVNPNGPYDAIELCGTACNQLKQVGKADVNYFCMPG
ncbi:MAG: VWA domain-containing protein [Myxococcales bacterium]|nr:VWA domain-containing protein [Myxococcales bacterium]